MEIASRLSVDAVLAYSFTWPGEYTSQKPTWPMRWLTRDGVIAHADMEKLVTAFSLAWNRLRSMTSVFQCHIEPCMAEHELGRFNPKLLADMRGAAVPQLVGRPLGDAQPVTGPMDHPPVGRRGVPVADGPVGLLGVGFLVRPAVAGGPGVALAFGFAWREQEPVDGPVGRHEHLDDALGPAAEVMDPLGIVKNSFVRSLCHIESVIVRTADVPAGSQSGRSLLSATTLVLVVSSASWTSDAAVGCIFVIKMSCFVTKYGKNALSENTSGRKRNQ